MGISLKAEHLKRYKDIAWLFVKYGRSDLVKRAGLDDALDAYEEPRRSSPAEATELADDFERLGPTFIKLGQLLSTRADLLPMPYLEALSRLQDEVEPFPSDEARLILETELVVRSSKEIAAFD